MPTAEKAALLSKSISMLQERHGSRFGEGPKVELFHALSDLRALADELAADLSRTGGGES